MYCRMCGKLLDDTDRHCRYCGSVTGFQEIPAETQKPMEEEVVFNPPFESDERQNSFQLMEEEPQTEEIAEENLKEFISENEIEEQKKQEDGTGEPSAGKSNEFTWNVHEFPKIKKTDDIEFKWELDEYGHQEQKAVDAAVFEEELFQEIRDEANRIKESNIDRFFTFSKKNEEFQELLDKEYEKFNRRPETLAKAEPGQAIETAAPQEELHTAEAAPMEEAVSEELIPEEIPETVIIETAEIVSENETLETEDIIPEIVITEAAYTIPETEIQEEAEIISEAEIPETIDATPKAEHLQEMAQARASFFGADLIQDNATIKKKLEGPEDIQSEPVPEEFAEIAEINETAEPDRSGKTTEDYIREEEEKHNAKNNVQNEVEIIDTNNENTTDIITESEGLQTKVPEALHAFNYTEMEEEEVDEKELRRNRIGKIVLLIIGIILVLEVSILGIRYIAPNSGAGKALNAAQIGVIDTVTSWFDSISDMISGNDSNDEVKQEESDKQQEKEDTSNAEQQPQVTEEESTPADPIPMADKAALVATQLGNNANIQQVKANDTFAYQEGRDYGLADLNQSKPIANNVWMTPQGADPVYYDRSIVGTIIAFDSQWIDYVSGSSKSILDLLKKDSEAYEKTVNYPKIGKVQETFKLLEIGEIRQGSQGFYVWAHEEIQLTEKGKTSDRKYNWIYYLEPVDGKMNIVNYFKF